MRDWGGAGYWPCPRLAPRRLTGSPAACGVWRVMVWNAMVFESEIRWSHHRYVRARRPTLRTNWLRDAASYWSESPMVLSPEGWNTLCRVLAMPAACAAGGSRDPPAAFGDRTGGLRTKVSAISAWARALQKPAVRRSVRWES